MTLTDPTNGILTSTYFATGLRSELVTPSGVTNYVRDGQNVLIESNSSGITQAHYTDNPGYWGGLTSQRRSGSSSFYGFDLSSNARVLTSAAALQIATFLTDAFGVEKSNAGSIANSFWFSGMFGLYRDVPNRLYAQARFLDTVKGRWPNRDPLGSAGGLNLYQYVGNNPVKWVDPSGLVVASCQDIPEPAPWEKLPVCKTFPDDTAYCTEYCRESNQDLDEAICNAVHHTSISIIIFTVWHCQLECTCKDQPKSYATCEDSYEECTEKGWIGSCSACLKECNQNMRSGIGGWPFGVCYPRRKRKSKCG